MKKIVKNILVCFFAVVMILQNLYPITATEIENEQIVLNKDAEIVGEDVDSKDNVEILTENVEVSTEIVNEVEDTDSEGCLDKEEYQKNEVESEENNETRDEMELSALNVANFEESDTEVDKEDPLYSRYYDENGKIRENKYNDVTFGISEVNSANARLGFDVSYFQGNINWEVAKNAGIEFAIIRVGYRRNSTGEICEDNKYDSYIRGAKAAGIKVGAYFYSEAITKAEAVEEANFLLDRVKLYDMDLPLVIDYEGFTDDQRIGIAGLSKQQHTEIVSAFCDKIKDSGYVPMIYSSATFFVTYLDGMALSNNYKIWSASWGKRPEQYNNVPYDFWQWSADGNGLGSKYGVSSTDIDLDYWYDDGTISKGKYSICNGVYTIASKLNTSKVLDIPYASIANGANVQLYSANGSNAQKFKITYLGKGLYSIINLNSNKSLDVFNNWTSNGTNVQQYAWNNSYAQKWIIKPTNDGYYTIISPVSNKALDIAYASTANGANVQIYQSNGSDAQKFKLTLEDRIYPVNEGLYTISSASNNSKVLDVYAGSQSNGGNIQLYSSNGTDAQKFILNKLENGYYTIINFNSGKVLEVRGASYLSGSNVQQNDYNGGLRQKWILRDSGDGYYYIISALSGNYLDLSGGYTNNGTNIQVYSPNGSSAQKYKFNAITLEKPISGNYYISSAVNNQYVLDVYCGSKNNGENVQLYKKNNTKAQQFEIKYLNNGFYSISNLNSGLVLDVYAGNKDNGGNIQQYSYNGSKAQKWILRKNSDGTYTFINAGSGKALDIYAGLIKNGSNIQQYSDNGTLAQKFVLSKMN